MSSNSVNLAINVYTQNSIESACCILCLDLSELLKSTLITTLYVRRCFCHDD